MERKEMTREMEAYIVLLHLVSQGYASFADIMHLLGWKRYYQAVAQRIVDHINRKLPALSKEWGEDIPQINAFVFITGSGKCSDYICKYVFGYEEKGAQPSARQIAEYAKKIATYPNWDKVLEVFREEAFKSTTQ